MKFSFVKLNLKCSLKVSWLIYRIVNIFKPHIVSHVSCFLCFLTSKSPVRRSNGQQRRFSEVTQFLAVHITFEVSSRQKRRQSGISMSKLASTPRREKSKHHSAILDLTNQSRVLWQPELLVHHMAVFPRVCLGAAGGACKQLSNCSRTIFREWRGKKKGDME